MENIENLTKIVAKNLVYYRKSSGYTQIQVAEMFNYSDKSISKWERGEGMPDIFILKQLAELYNISMEDFFKEKVKKIRVISNKAHIIITSLSAGLVWLVAVTIYVLLMMFGLPEYDPLIWLTFIYAIPAMFIVVVVFACIWFSLWIQCLSVSALTWSVAGALFAGLHFGNIRLSWLVFIVALVLQFLILLWYLLKRRTKKEII